jgi:putative nucleotidyltransferase with HDIG domain
MTPRVLVLDPDPDSCIASIAALASLGCDCVGESTGEFESSHSPGGPVDVVLVAGRASRAHAVARVMGLRAADPYLGVVVVTDSGAPTSGIDIHLGASEWLLNQVDPLGVAAAVVRVATRRAEDMRTREYVDGLDATIHARSALLVAKLQPITARDADGARSLLRTLSECHPEVMRHASRVAAHAVGLAVAWGLPAAGVADVEMGALLHDIGKLAIPELLLDRPGPLTDAEIALVRTHPRIGAFIVRRIGLDRVADIVLAAHERFDGRGYPGGIAGQAIPIGARIVATVDVYDALTSARVYRDPVSCASAAAAIAQAAGSQFDPDLVRAWLRSLQQDLERSA